MNNLSVKNYLATTILQLVKGYILSTMAATNSNPLYTKLDTLYQTIDGLTLNSTSEKFDAFGAFFSGNCTVYLKSIHAYDEPSIG